MRRIAVLLILPFLCDCSRTGPTERSAPEQAFVTLSVVATNDVHGRLDLLPAFAGYVDAVRQLRKKDGGVVLVDAGDAFQGTIESNSNEGAAVVAAYNEMGYAALAIGNHEFDFGPAGPAAAPSGRAEDPHGALKALIRQARFPFLSANLVGEDGKYPEWPNLRHSALVTVSGIKVGIVGGLTEEAESVIKRSNFAGLDVTPLSQALSREAGALRARGADIVVGLVHAGGRCTRFEDPRDLSSCETESELFKVAGALPAGSIDVLVGGHRDQGVSHFVAGVPVVHAHSYLEAFSRVDLVYDRAARRVVGRRIFPPHELCAAGAAGECKPHAYEGKLVRRNDRVASVIRPALERALALRGKSLGVKIAKPLVADKRGECALGNLFVDLMRQAVPEADVAFANGGSLREDLPAGELTFGALHRAMPFDNHLAKFRLTGAELRSLLSANVSQQNHGLVSVSGVRARVGCAGGRPEVTLSREDGRPIRDDEELLVVTNDFVAMGGDGLLSSIPLQDRDVEIDVKLPVRDVLLAGIRARTQALSSDDPGLFDPKKPRIEFSGAPCR